MNTRIKSTVPSAGKPIKTTIYSVLQVIKTLYIVVVTYKPVTKGGIIMKTNEILHIIFSNGGFDNFNHWSEKEIAKWVRANFTCSYYVSRQVAKVLV